MVYSIWLFALSASFLIAERLWPEKPQRLYRKGFLQDLAYLVFYSEYLGVLLGVLSIRAISVLDRSLDTAGAKALVYLRLLTGSRSGCSFPSCYSPSTSHSG